MLAPVAVLALVTTLQAGGAAAQPASAYPDDPHWPQICGTQQVVAVTTCTSTPSAAPTPAWADTIWRDTPGSPEVTIAVVDSCVEALGGWWPEVGHELGARIARRTSSLPCSMAGGGWYLDRADAVVQVAAAAGGNGYAGAGMAWNARVNSYAVQYRGTYDYITNHALIPAALRQAADDGAGVVQLSIDVPVAQTSVVAELETAIAYARARGVIIVVAAGAEAAAGAQSDDVIAVTGVDNAGAPGYPTLGPWIDLSAPDETIVNFHGSTGEQRRASVAIAAARVTGLIALMKTYDPGLTQDEASTILQSTATPLDPALGAGAGIVNGVAAVDALQAIPGVCAAATSAYLLDGFGARHPVGAAPPAPSGTGTYWNGWDIARGIDIMPGDAGAYVVDGYGGIHWTQLGGVLPPATTPTPYWYGWDIVRDIALLPDGTGGYLLDGWGGLHPFATAGNTPPPLPLDNPYWPGWDIARSLTLTATGGGYVLDGWGGIHPFTLPGGTTPPAPTGNTYWPGWDIARGLTLAHDDTGNRTGGYVLDGWGGNHPFATGATTPPPLRNTPYWPGWNIARDLQTRIVCN